MRRTILTSRKVDYLFDHLLDGYRSTHEGAEFILKEGIIDEKEHYELLKKNAERLIARIHEFKITHKLISFAFVLMFTWMQVSGDSLDMRRTRRTRRRNENELFNNQLAN